MDLEFSHLDQEGTASMVNVGHKTEVKRYACAEGKIHLSQTVIQMIRNNEIQKGSVLSCARIAGIMGAKKCSELIPLCHQLLIDKISVDFQIEPTYILIKAEAFCTGKTGIEMEALTAVNIAALTIWDMCKAVDKTMSITDIVLIEKLKSEEA
ncbi:MAG: cyclic pyranopterin monophosphate synthase MoaC [Brevinemataceae bacterium]